MTRRSSPLPSPVTSRSSSRRRAETASVLRLAGVERGTDDAGRVAQCGRDDLGVDVDEGQELAGLLAHAASDDDQLGGEQVLELAVVRRQPLRPGLPRQVLALPGARGRTRLGVVAVDLEVAELGV